MLKTYINVCPLFCCYNLCVDERKYTINIGCEFSCKKIIFGSNLALESYNIWKVKGITNSDSGCNEATLHIMSQYGWKFAPGSATLQLRVFNYFRVGARLPWVVTGKVALQKGKKISDSGCNNTTAHTVSQTGWKFAPESDTLYLRGYKYWRAGARLLWVG